MLRADPGSGSGSARLCPERLKAAPLFLWQRRMEGVAESDGKGFAPAGGCQKGPMAVLAAKACEAERVN